MAEHSDIEWTDATWNPVTGCTKVSPGCKNCYAEVFAERFRGVPGHPYEQGFDLKLWPDRLDLPLRWTRPKRIFVNSMSDLFHERVPDDLIDRVFETMWFATWHTSWLTLAPKNKITGGRLISSKTQPSTNRAAAMLRMCAMGVGKTSTALGAYYRRIAYRVGKPKAITATARKLAILVYRVLRGDIDYCDPGADAYEAHHRTRTLRNLRNRAQRLGFALFNLESGEVLQGEAS